MPSFLKDGIFLLCYLGFNDEIIVFIAGKKEKLNQNYKGRLRGI